MSVVEQLANGVKVRLADGTEVVCKPLSLTAGMRIVDLWAKRTNPRLRELSEQLKADPTPERREEIERELLPLAQASADARREIARVFLAEYPDLGPKISGGDVEVLVPDFFWSESGAAVVVAMPPTAEAATGTPSSKSTLPSGETSPT